MSVSALSSDAVPGGLLLCGVSSCWGLLSSERHRAGFGALLSAQQYPGSQLGDAPENAVRQVNTCVCMCAPVSVSVCPTVHVFGERQADRPLFM